MLGTRQCHGRLPLQADAQLTAKLVQFRFAHRLQSIGDAAKATIGRKEVTVLHLPKLAVLVAEPASRVDGTVDLMVGRLTNRI